MRSSTLTCSRARLWGGAAGLAFLACWGSGSALAQTVARAAKNLRLMSVTSADIDQRLAQARGLFDDIDVFVAPSKSVAEEFRRLGVARSRIRVSDYGFPDRGVRVDRCGQSPPAGSPPALETA